MATFREGVFRRDKGVWRRALNVVRQAGPRNVWMRSAWPCLPSPKSRVDLSLGDAEGRTLLVGTGKALGVHALGCSRRLFTSRQGRDIRGTGSTTDEGVEARRQAGQSSGERGGAADGGAWCAWPLLVRRKAEEGTRKARQSRERREEEAEHEQVHEHMKGHTHPRCLRWEAWRASLRRKEKQSLSCCQAIGRDV